jgi:hypothetical protein
MRMKNVCCVGLIVSLLVVVDLFAGDINPPGAPTDAAGQMFTTEDIYNRLNDGTAGTKKTTFTEPSSGPASSGKTLDEIMAKAPVKDNATEHLLLIFFWGKNTGG